MYREPPTVDREDSTLLGHPFIPPELHSKIALHSCVESQAQLSSVSTEAPGSTEHYLEHLFLISKNQNKPIRQENLYR